MTNKKRNEK